MYILIYERLQCVSKKKKQKRVVLKTLEFMFRRTSRRVGKSAGRETKNLARPITKRTIAGLLEFILHANPHRHRRPSFSLSLSLAAVIPCVRDGETSTRRRRARRRQRPRPRPRRGRPRRRRGGGSAAAQGCEVGWCGGGGVAVRVQSSCPQLQRPPLPHPVTRSFPFFFLFSLATNYVLYCLAPLVGSPNQ
jgi:hypothetical protein